MYTAACCRHLAAKGYPDHGGHAGQQQATRSCGSSQALGPQLRAGRAARLSALPQGRHRRRRGRAASTGRRYSVKLVHGRRGLQRGVAHAGRRARSAPTEPLLRLGLALRHRRRRRARQRDAAQSIADPPLPRRATPTPRARCSASRACRRWCSTTRDALLRDARRDAAVLRRQRRAADPLPHRRQRRPDRPTTRCCAFLAAPRLRPARRARRRCRGVRPLPFVCVFGRADFTVSYFGANIYPGERDGRRWSSRRSRLGDRQVRPAGARGRRPRAATSPSWSSSRPATRRRPRGPERASPARSWRQLLRLNSEFANYVPAGTSAPHVELRPAGDPDYFPRGVKHRYTRPER